MEKIKLRDKQTGKIIDVDQDQLAGMYSPDKFSIQTGKEVSVKSPDGQIGSVPSEKLKDALSSGFTQYTPAMKQKDENKAWAENNPGLAALKAVASGLTVTASDLAIAKVADTFFDEKEAAIVKDRAVQLEEQWPILSGGLETASSIAPIVLSGGTGLGARALGKAGALTLGSEKIGLEAAKQAGKLATKVLGNEGGKAATRSAIKDIVQTGMKWGAGSATEGALYGIGSTISEAALENKELTAEAIIQDTITSAGIGGIFGAGLGSLGKTISKGVSGVSKKMTLRTIDNLPVDAATKQRGKSRYEREQIIDQGLRDIKINRDVDTEAAARRLVGDELDLPATITAGKQGDKLMAYDLANSPTSIGIAEQQKNLAVREAAINKIDNDILKSGKKSKVVSGEDGKNIIKSNIEIESSKYQELFETVDMEFGRVPINKKSIDSTFKKYIKNAAKEEKGFLKELEQAQSRLRASEYIDEIKNVQATIWDLAESSQREGKNSLSNKYKNLYSELKKLFDNSAASSIKDPIKRDTFIGMTRAANEQYAAVRNANEPLLKRLGINDFPPPGQRLDKLFERIDPEDVTKLLSQTNDINLMKMLQKDHPDLYNVMKMNIVADIFRKSTNDTGEQSVLSLQKFVTNMNKLKKDSPEIANMVFDKKAWQSVKDVASIEKYLAKNTMNVPTGFNKIGTNFSIANLLGIGPYAKDRLRSSLLYGDAKKVRNLALGNALTIAELEGKRRTLIKKINKTTAKFLNATNRTIRGSILPHVKPDMKEINQVEDFIKEYNENPQLFIDNFIKENQDMIEVAPETTNAVQQTTMRVVNFIQQKMPKQDFDYYGMPREINRGQAFQFNDYLRTVMDSNRFMTDLENGYVSKRQVEAMEAVYPETLSAIRGSIMEQLEKEKSITPGRKRIIQDMVGIAMRPSSEPRNLVFLQSKLGEMDQAQIQGQSPQQNNNTEKKNLTRASGKVKQSGRSMSGLDNIIYRRNS